ncbi:MAG TPA: hypothetical protein VHE83_17630 [Mycobacteriales bacterium]|nr:hypothetical protein [Mycobacteriales bacterium]
MTVAPARESAVAQTARRAAREAAARRRRRVAVPAQDRAATPAPRTPSFAWQRILRDEARAARAHRDEVRAALRELDRHLDMGDELTRRLTLFPGCPVH